MYVVNSSEIDDGNNIGNRLLVYYETSANTY
jgi:hypothetical protein